MEPNRELDSKILLGRYRIVRLLAEGGMGKIYLARVEGAAGFTRPVVVKVMRTDMRDAEQANRLFKREAQILSKMQHPAIINIIDFGIEDGAHIMVLEYVHGYALAQWLDYRYVMKRSISVDLSLFIVRRVLDALHYAHHFDTDEGQEVAIIHRDIAPDNVLLDHKGYVYLLDFGIASMTGPNRGGSTTSGVFRGKLSYAAPETVEGELATPQSDQYSAGVLLLELLIQETPFQSDSVGETVLRMVNELPPAPSSRRDDIPAGLDEIIAKTLEKRPEHRFDSVRDLSRELRRLQQDDDEDVAQELKRIICTDFSQLSQFVDVESLDVREEALARIFPQLSTGLRDALSDDENTQADARSTLPASLAEKGRGENRLHRLLLGLLIVGGVIALGLGAAVALLSKGGSKQVVVVGGKNEGMSLTDLANRQATESNTGSDNDGAEPVVLTEGQKLSGAVQEQSSAYETCFVKYLKQAEKTPEASLRFSVRKEGGTAQVEIEPVALASSPLGACLVEAAGEVVFAPLSKATTFRVPVRAHFSRLQ